MARHVSSPLKVLHYYGTNYGMTGVESFILQLTHAQRRAGLAPGIMIDLPGREDLVRQAGGIGVAVHAMPQPMRSSLPGVGKLARMVNGLRSILALWTVVRRYDVLHLHAAGLTGTEALIAAIAGRWKIIVTNHMTIAAYRRYWRRLGSLNLWLQKRFASACVMPYEQAAQQLREIGVPAELVRVIPYCIDEVRFSGHHLPPQPGEPFRIVMVSRLHEGKGHDVLLAALAVLRDRGHALHLSIVGQGDTLPAIEQQIRELDLGSLVTLCGQVDHELIPALLKQSHLIVLPSWMEGETFPLCLLEAALLGLPAIGTRWNGIPAIIEDGRTGILVEPRSSGDIVAAIERLLTDPGLYAQMSARAAQRARQNYTAGRIAETYRALYESAAR